MSGAHKTPPQGYQLIQLKYGPYSASRLQVARCPARFRSKYILKDKIISDTLAAARGSAIHEVLQKITEHHAVSKEITPAMVNTWVEQAIGKFPAAYEQVKTIKDACSAYVGNVSPYLKPNTKCEVELGVSLWEEESFMDDITPARAFVREEVRSPDGRLNPNVFFTVKVDQITADHELRIVTILDHKSTPSANKNPDYDFQMGVYAWMASLYVPGYTVRTVLHYAHPKLNFYAPPVYWEEQDLKDIEDEILMRIRASESFEEFPALPGTSCDYCHMVQMCPENRAIQEQNARGDINLNIQTIDDMVRVAKQLRVTGALYDQLNKKLKEATETLCPESGVAIEGMWYGYKPSDEKVDWDATDIRIKEESKRAKILLVGGNLNELDRDRLQKTAEYDGLYSMLRKSGVEAEVFLSWKSDKMKALWKLGKVELIDTLKPFLVTYRDTRFGGHKV